VADASDFEPVQWRLKNTNITIEKCPGKAIFTVSDSQTIDFRTFGSADYTLKNRLQYEFPPATKLQWRPLTDDHNYDQLEFHSLEEAIFAINSIATIEASKL